MPNPVELLPAIALATTLVAGCASDPACWASGSCGAGETCTDDVHCASGLCTAGACEPSCAAHSDCTAGTACVRVLLASSLRQHCSASCGFDEDLIDSTEPIICEGGVPTTCAEATAPGEHCNVCGCAAGSNCFGADFGCGGFCECRVAMPVGSPCEVDEDCVSMNCSGGNETNPSFCQVAAGEICDPAASMQCAYCEEREAGTFRCSQSCVGDLECPGGYCLGDRTTDRFRCLANCEETRSCSPGFVCDFIAELNFRDGGYACVPMR